MCAPQTSLHTPFSGNATSGMRPAPLVYRPAHEDLRSDLLSRATRPLGL